MVAVAALVVAYQTYPSLVQPVALVDLVALVPVVVAVVVGQLLAGLLATVDRAAHQWFCLFM